MDERCAACVMGPYGDTEEPCVSQVELALYKDPPPSLEPHRRPLLGQLCPRVELEPGNAEAAQLVGFAIHEMKRAWQQPMFDALTAHFSDDERAALLLRISGAISDPVVHEILYPKPKSADE